MKKSYFMPLLAAMALTACSEKEEPGIGGGESSDYGYVAVNIIQPTEQSSSRAASDNFEYGDPSENNAATGMFFIFNEAGTQRIGAAQTVALTKSTTTGNAPEVEAIYNTLLVVKGDSETEKPDAKQIVCVLNAPASLASCATLDDLKQQVADYSAHTDGTFIMSNSVYMDGTTTELGAAIDDENIFKTSQEALANPVDIYVERVVAKIRANSAENFTNNNASVTIGNEDIPLNINVTGIEVANIAKTSYLLKDITAVAAEGETPWTNWSWVWDPANKRSYWETCPTGLTYANKSYNTITSESSESFDIKNVANYTEYVQPNTTSQKTSVLVTAQLTRKDNKEALNFVYLQGRYYTPDGAMAVIAQALAGAGYYKKTSEEGADEDAYSELAVSDLVWKNNKDLAANEQISWLEDYEVVARLADSNMTIYEKTGDKTYAPITAESAKQSVNDYLAEADHQLIARYYNDGLCYYFVEIDQTPVAIQQGETGAKAGTYQGVVRNHIYDLTLNSIGGLGTPIFDPTDEIIPQRPDKESYWYLSAQIHVLAWRLVKQTVDFEGIQ